MLLRAFAGTVRPCVVLCKCTDELCYCPRTGSGEPCAPAMVEQTVMEPVTVTETRKVQVTEYKQEQRERRYTVQKQVPRTENRTRTVSYTENENRTREEKYIENRTVSETVDQQYTVQVPYTEMRKGNDFVVTPTVTKNIEADLHESTFPTRKCIREPVAW